MPSSKVAPSPFTSTFAFSSRFTFASSPFTAARTRSRFAASLDIAAEEPARRAPTRSPKNGVARRAAVRRRRARRRFRRARSRRGLPHRPRPRPGRHSRARLPGQLPEAAARPLHVCRTHHSVLCFLTFLSFPFISSLFYSLNNIIVASSCLCCFIYKDNNKLLKEKEKEKEKH